VIVKKDTVAEVVKEASTKMTDPNYSAVMVGGFVQTQPQVAQYITAHAQDVGGAEGVAHVVFHAALVSLCFQRANNRSVPQLSFEDLDRASGDDGAERLKKRQPYVYEFLEQNVEDVPMRKVLALLALAMDWTM
jgi:hypothetical protein